MDLRATRRLLIGATLIYCISMIVLALLWVAAGQQTWWLALSNVFAESYWNPGDWRPVKVSYLPRPWGLRIEDPLTNREDGAFFAPFVPSRQSLPVFLSAFSASPR